MLIGFAGRRGAGKDAAGAFLVEWHGFQRFAFADAVKELAREIGWDGAKDDAGRTLLQDLGQGARKVLGERVWIEEVDRRLYVNSPHDAVITDVRMPNEVDYVHAWQGIVIRIVRPEVDRSGQADQHVTEALTDGLEVDAEIVNDGTLEELHAKVETVVANLRTDRRLTAG